MANFPLGFLLMVFTYLLSLLRASWGASFLPTWVLISLSGFRPRRLRLSWEPPRFSRDKVEALSSTEFRLEKDLEALRTELELSDGLPATGIFFICWNTFWRSELEGSDSPSSSLFVSLLNCSFSLLSTTAVKVGTARPRCTTKPSWSWVTPASVRLLGWLAAIRQKEAKMRTKIENWLMEARIVGNESCTTVLLKT